MMKQEIDCTLPVGSFRIICKKCKIVFVDAKGGITEWAIAASRISDICPHCGGDVILQGNPEPIHKKYDAEHPYPDFK